MRMSTGCLLPAQDRGFWEEAAGECDGERVARAAQVVAAIVVPRRLVRSAYRATIGDALLDRRLKTTMVMDIIYDNER
jgi:hypothetical protein